MLTLDGLRTFIVVVRTGGIAKAAHALNLTQPAVSARIKKLETDIGDALFDRAQGVGKLTKRGEVLLQYALKMESLSDQIERDVIDPRGIEDYLRIGASETIAQCWLPDFVAALNQRFPRMTIELNVDVSVNLRDSLIAREIDLAILLGPISEYTVQNIDLPGFALVWYASPATATLPAGPARLFDKPVVTYARNTKPYREMRNGLIEHVGIDVPTFTSSSLSACFRLIEQGLGVGALPEALGASLAAAGRVVAFDPGWRPPPLQFTASYLADPPSHRIVQAAALAGEIARSVRDYKNI